MLIFCTQIKYKISKPCRKFSVFPTCCELILDENRQLKHLSCTKKHSVPHLDREHYFCARGIPPLRKLFTSLCFVFPNFWNNPTRFTFDFEKVGLIPFASLCSSKILEQPGRFCFDLQNFRNKQFVLLSIFLYFGLNSFSLRS
jgi:hypothetical protein